MKDGGPLSWGAELLRDLIYLLEGQDRWRFLAQPVWHALAKDHVAAADARAFDRALKELLDGGLLRVAARATPPLTAEYETVDATLPAIRSRVEPGRANAVLELMVGAWGEMFAQEAASPGDDTVRAGVSASVYLSRLDRFEDAFALLEQQVLPVARRTGQDALVFLRLQLVAVESGDLRLAARVESLRAGGGAEGFRRLGEWVEELAAQGRLDAAVTVANVQFEDVLATRPAREALEIAKTAVRHAAEGGLAASTQALWRQREVALLHRLGDHRAVLDLVALAIRASEQALDAGGESPDGRRRYEQMLAEGVGAAKVCRDWPRALELNARLAASLESRGADRQERARRKWEDHAPLLELGRTAEAERVLHECAAEFDEESEAAGLVLAARAAAASRAGEQEAAQAQYRTAFRLVYRFPGNERAKAHMHRNYGNLLLRLGRSPDERAAHWLAAALLYRLLGSKADEESILGFLILAHQSSEAPIPRTRTQLVAVVERSEGAKLGELLASLGESTRHVARELSKLIGEVEGAGRRAHRP